MSMINCRGCATEIHESAVSCPKCGATQASAQLSESWRRTFASIEKAGGPKLPNVRNLTSAEKQRVSYNILAFLFAFIYYIVKGMWRKAITLFVLCLVGTLILEVILHAMKVDQMYIDIMNWAVTGVVFGVRANIDYYKKIELGDNGWL